MAYESGKLWGGRFSESPDARLEAFNASIFFDQRIGREDIRGSIAHARMLGKQGIIDPADAAIIEDGLWQVMAEFEAGTLELTIKDEDIHTGVERRLREIIGVPAGRLHTGRSRNDQVATGFRLWTKGAIIDIAAGLAELTAALLDVAAANPDAVMPGYTHLQRAQPVLFAHHMLAYVAMLERDLDRIRDAYRRTDVMPLGAGALAGVTYPIDRESVAKDLGFAAITANSLDAVSDRDFVIDVLSACALISMHVSRLSEEIIFWATGEARFVELSDAFSTGSSIMPQKKNPDVAELGRGKTGRVYGHLIGMLTVAKGLPLSYNKDFQEDKEALFDTVDTILMVLDVFPPMLRTMKLREDRMLAAAVADFSLATDAADLLARRGVPFREAHEVVSRLVRTCIAEGSDFSTLTDAQWAAFHPVFASEKPALTALESVAARDVPGGTAPNRVAAARVAAAEALTRQREWVSGRIADRAALFDRP